jgi:hypothetical protein
MRLLLDTHILLWALAEPKKIPKQTRAQIEAAGNAACRSRTISFCASSSTAAPWMARITGWPAGASCRPRTSRSSIFRSCAAGALRTTTRPAQSPSSSSTRPWRVSTGRMAIPSVSVDVTFDYPRNMLWLVPNERFGEERSRWAHQPSVMWSARQNSRAESGAEGHSRSSRF